MTSVYVASYDLAFHTCPRDFHVYYYEFDNSSFESINKEWISFWLPWNYAWD
jgi:hypothetical protein